ncbi:hypothetical protein D9M71_315090 [compost metagenome]
MGRTDHTEQRAFVRAFEPLPGLAPIGGTEHGALLTDDEQAGILDRSDAVEVVLVFVVDAVADVFPVFAAVGGFQQCTVSAHGKTVVEVLEPHIKQGGFAFEVFELFGPGGTGVAGHQDLRIVAYRPTMAGVDKEDRGEQLPGRHLGLVPGGALVVGVKNMAAVAHCNQP